LQGKGSRPTFFIVRQKWVNAVQKVGAILLARNDQIIGVDFLNRSFAIDARFESTLLGEPSDLAQDRGLASYDSDFPSKFVFYSLERVDKFESNHELFRRLLRDYFPL